MSAKLSQARLNAALLTLAKAHNRANAARAVIFAHSEEVYGMTPSDAGNDQFIDAVDGGCGDSSGMTAEEFDASMKEAVARRRK